MEQFTAISGRKMPRAPYRAGANFSTHLHELHHGRDDRDERGEAEEAEVDVGVVGAE